MGKKILVPFYIIVTLIISFALIIITPLPYMHQEAYAGKEVTLSIGSIDYFGAGGWGYTHHFSVDGNVAYCTQATQTTPDAGKYERRKISNKKVIAVLYYGNGGPKDKNWDYVDVHLLICAAYGRTWHGGKISVTESHIDKVNSHLKYINEHVDDVPSWFDDCCFEINWGNSDQNIAYCEYSPRAGLKITKYEKYSGEPIKGIDFTIYKSDSDGNKHGEVKTITTDKNGVAKTGKGDLEIGSYYYIVEDLTKNQAKKYRTNNWTEGKKIKISKDTEINEYYELTVENTAKTEIEVEKKWKAVHIPNQISVQLYANGKPQGDTVVLSKSNGWKYEFKNLKKLDAQGNEIEYTVKEVGTSNGRIKINGINYKVNVNGYTITNIEESTGYNVRKVWNDGNDPNRPKEIVGRLMRGIGNDTVGDVVQEFVLNDANNWSLSFSSLPKYDDNGNLYRYWCVEDVPYGYTVSYENNGETMIMKNTKAPTEIPVRKVWANGNNNNSSKSVTVRLYKNGSPTDMTATLNSGNNWSHTFTGLDAIDIATGQDITYTVKEENIEDGVTVNYINNGTELIIVNTSNTKIDIPVQKQWNDNGNADGTRPSQITFNLYRESAHRTKELIATKTVGSNENWKWTFTDLPEYDTEYVGDKFIYTADEASVPDGYTKTSVTGNQDGGFTIVNRCDQTSSSVRKLWIGNDKLSEIYVTLYADGYSTGTRVKLNSSNNWSYTATKLKKYSGNHLIVYKWVEDSYDGYISTGTANNDEYTITNFKIKTTIDTSVTKIWDDDGDESKRPDSISVTLRRGTHSETQNGVLH